MHMHLNLIMFATVITEITATTFSDRNIYTHQGINNLKI